MLYPTRVWRPTLFGSGPCRFALMGYGIMAAPTWARARARAGPHPACVRARSGRR